jgi:hypothetical protein
LAPPSSSTIPPTEPTPTPTQLSSSTTPAFICIYRYTAFTFNYTTYRAYTYTYATFLFNYTT